MLFPNIPLGPQEDDPLDALDQQLAEQESRLRALLEEQRNRKIEPPMKIPNPSALEAIGAALQGPERLNQLTDRTLQIQQENLDRLEAFREKVRQEKARIDAAEFGLDYDKYTRLIDLKHSLAERERVAQLNAKYGVKNAAEVRRRATGILKSLEDDPENFNLERVLSDPQQMDTLMFYYSTEDPGTVKSLLENRRNGAIRERREAEEAARRQDTRIEQSDTRIGLSEQSRLDRLDKEHADVVKELSDTKAQLAEGKSELSPGLLERLLKRLSGEKVEFTDEELDKPVKLKTADKEFRTLRALLEKVEELERRRDRLSKEIGVERKKPVTPEKAAEKATETPGVDVDKMVDELLPNFLGNG